MVYLRQTKKPQDHIQVALSYHGYILEPDLKQENHTILCGTETFLLRSSENDLDSTVSVNETIAVLCELSED